MDIAAEIRAKLQKAANKERAEHETGYFKGTIRPYGTGLQKAHDVADEIFQIYNPSLESSVALAEKLFRESWFEEGIVGVYLVIRHRKDFCPEMLAIFERWVENYITNWAHCDDLSAHLIAEVLAKYPETAKKLVTWTSSKNRWKKRAAAVSFIFEAKKGNHFKEIFMIANALIKDKDDMVQKSCGWMLREAVKGNEKKALQFLEKHKHQLPRITLRYAIERLPEAKRKELLK